MLTVPSLNRQEETTKRREFKSRKRPQGNYLQPGSSNAQEKQRKFSFHLFI